MTDILSHTAENLHHRSDNATPHPPPPVLRSRHSGPAPGASAATWSGVRAQAPGAGASGLAAASRGPQSGGRRNPGGRFCGAGRQGGPGGSAPARLQGGPGAPRGRSAPDPPTVGAGSRPCRALPSPALPCPARGGPGRGGGPAPRGRGGGGGGGGGESPPASSGSAWRPVWAIVPPPSRGRPDAPSVFTQLQLSPDSCTFSLPLFYVFTGKMVKNA